MDPGVVERNDKTVSLVYGVYDPNIASPSEDKHSIVAKTWEYFSCLCCAKSYTIQYKATRYSSFEYSAPIIAEVLQRVNKSKP